MSVAEESPEVERVLARVKRQLAPTGLDRERVLAATLACVAVPSSLAAASPNGTAREPGAWGEVTAWGRKLGSVLGVAIVSAGAGYQVGRHSRPEPALSAAHPTVFSPSVPPAPALVTTNHLPAPQPALVGAGREQRSMGDAAGSARSRVLEARPTGSAPAPAGSSALEEELRMLRRVERAQRQGNPRLALALLGELDEKVPAPGLAEERAAAETVARCSLGYGARAVLLSEFSSRYPSSVYGARVGEACETHPTAPATSEEQ